MKFFNTPNWLEGHLYKGKNFVDLDDKELLSLKKRILKFSTENPEVSVVIPAWNEENNIFRAISSITDSDTNYKVEIIVINNNSTDDTQKVLDKLGIKNYFQHKQGTPYARQMGLDMARGKYHLCADCDTFYPPKWIDAMVKPMMDNKGVVGVYGRYSFLPLNNRNRVGFVFYEILTSFIIRIRKKNYEHLNMLGFNMGFITEVGRNPNGFNVVGARKFDNAAGSNYYIEEAEDGRMAIQLKRKGKLKLVVGLKSRVYTSSRRLMYEGGIFKAFKNRFNLHLKAMSEYFMGKSKTKVL